MSIFPPYRAIARNAISPANDISRGSFGIVKVRTTLAGAHSIMTAAAYVHASYINAHREGRYVQLSSHKNPEDMSILASVMGVTQEVSCLTICAISSR